MNDDITTRSELILGLPWIVGTTIDQPAQPVAAEPAQPVHIDDTPAVRPWAKPLLTGAMALAAIWLAVLAIILLDAGLFEAASVSVGVAGIPILCLLTVAFMADPGHESPPQETYWTLEQPTFPIVLSQCSPSRHQLTGDRQ